jgi:cytochrome c-type biogenesis protein
MLGSEVSYFAAAGAGIVSFLSPCVLPLVPAYLSFIAGTSLDQMVDEDGVDPALSRRMLLSAMVFVLGFSVVFIMLGASASAMNDLIHSSFIVAERDVIVLDIITWVAGGIIVVFGLHYLGVFRAMGIFGFLQRDIRFHGEIKQRGLLGAFVIGLAFGFGWTPCIAPILGTILAIAGSSDSLGFGVSLLAVYSLGIGIPFILAAIALRPFMGFMGKFRRHMRRVEMGTGGILVVTGLAISMGGLTRVNAFLLDTFPILGQIG